MKIGYARVSTEDQNPDLQLAALKQAGCKRVFADKATGAHVQRPELAKCCGQAQPDTQLSTFLKLDGRPVAQRRMQTA